MKLQVTQENFNHALSSVARIADTHGTLPILANVLIKAAKNRLSVAATNLNIGITVFIGAKIESEGEITVPAALLASFISSLPSGVIQLELEDKKLKVQTDKYNSNINGISAEDFPVMPAIEGGEKIEVKAGDLKKALQQVTFAASPTGSRPALSGVYFSTSANNLYVAATDGSRLAEKTIQNKTPDVSMLVPASAMNDLLRIISDDTDKIKITINDQQALFSFGDAELVTRLIDSAYPNYKPLIPTKSSVSAVLKRADLFNIVKVSGLFARETGGSITIEVNEEGQNVQIKSLASQLGENDAQASAKVSGSGSITLNSRYLIDGINAFSGEDINFAFNGKVEPVLLSDSKDASYVHVIMPLKS
jgi:DNA polymerase-3 subunit beta